MESDTEKKSADIDFMKNFFYRLNEQRENQWLTDFVLRKGKLFIPCHKVVMRARTGIFSPEEDMDSYDITSNVPDAIILELVTYIYTFEIDMNTQNIPHLVELAEELSLEDLSHLCDDCLAKADINEENCFELYRFSRKHQFPRFRNRIQAFFLKSFDSLSTDARFLGLELDALVEIIQSDDLNVTDERRVLDAAKRWIEATEDRILLGEEILYHVRLPMINIQFEEYLRMKQQPIFFQQNAAVILDTAMRFLTSPAARWELSTRSARPRKYHFVRESLLVAVKSPEKLSFICHNAKSSSWVILPPNSSQQQQFSFNPVGPNHPMGFSPFGSSTFQQPHPLYASSSGFGNPFSTPASMGFFGARNLEAPANLAANNLPNRDSYNYPPFCSAVHDSLLFVLNSNICTVFNILTRNTSIDYLALQERFTATVDFPTQGLVAVATPDHICLIGKLACWKRSIIAWFVPGPVCKRFVLSHCAFQDFPAPHLIVADACPFYAYNKIYLLGGKTADGNAPTENRIVQIYDCENATWIILTEIDLPAEERILSAACFEGHIFVLCSSGCIYTFDTTTANMELFANLNCPPLRTASMCAYQNELFVTSWSKEGGVLMALDLSTMKTNRINSGIDLHSCCSTNPPALQVYSAFTNHSEHCDNCQRTNVSQCFPLILR